MKVKKILSLGLLTLGVVFPVACGAKEKDTADSVASASASTVEDNGSSASASSSDTNTPSSTASSGGNKNTQGNPSMESTFTPASQGTIVNDETKVKLLAASGDQEAAYVTFDSLDSATGYNAYISNGSSWTKIDSECVRTYVDENNETHYRADVTGLTSGTYSMKVVPLFAGVESDARSNTVSDLTVIAHSREGFAFVNGTANGAYNADGTLRSDADVYYVTNENKDTIVSSLDSSKVGVNNVIYSYAKQTAKTCDIRFIGNVTDATSLVDGDLLIDGITCGLTVEGIGDDATANGWGIRIKNSSNVEVRNIGVMNCDSKEGDDIGLQQGNDHIWVHNNDLFYGKEGSDADQVKGDGALDTKKSLYVTHSYNHFWDNGKCNLNGNKEAASSLNYITYHHNWYDHSDSRHPLVRCSTAVHVYNNYYDGCAKYGMISRLGASIFSEGNYFEDTKYPQLICNQGSEISAAIASETGGMIKSYGDYYENCTKVLTQYDSATDYDVYLASSATEVVPSTYVTLDGGTAYSNFETSSTMYSYKADSAIDAKSRVMEYAGRVNGGNFKIVFNDADAASYDVNQKIRDALTAYNGKATTVISETTGDAFVGQPEVVEDTTSWTLLSEETFDTELAVSTTAVTTGLYYDAVTDSTLNNINVADGKLNIVDNSSETTFGYYMFETLNSGKIKISVKCSDLISKGSWSFLTFIGSDGSNFICRTNSNKKIQFYNETSKTFSGTELSYTSSSVISLVYDFTAKTATLYVDSASTEVSEYTTAGLKGIKFTTAASDSRSFAVDTISFYQAA